MVIVVVSFNNNNNNNNNNNSLGFDGLARLKSRGSGGQVKSKFIESNGHARFDEK
jgi:hypothetical protein